jgi:hypothetical protein
MPIRLDRNRDHADDPWILLKVRLFSAGAALALGGMFLEISWLIWAALGVLGAGVALRFVPHPLPWMQAPGEAEGQGEEDEEAADDLQT